MWNVRHPLFRVFALFFLITVILWASGIVPQVYQFVTANGGSANQGNTLNFGNTSSVTWSCSTTSGITTCSATSSGSGGSALTINNASSTGTTVNTLTKLTGAPSTAVISATTDTGGAIGITTAGAGTTGAATIAISGQVSCVFDGATTAGDYVQISSTTAGNCHDGISTYPSSGQVIGRVLSTNGSGGTYTIDLFPAEIQGSSTSVSFNNITTGTNTSATMTVGSGATVTVSGTGINNANEVNGATVPASGTVVGTNSSSQVISPTAATVTAFLNTFTGLLQGLAPASGGGMTNFLRADGSWAAPAPTALALSIATKTTTYLFLSTDYAINCNATSAGFTTSLEASPTTGRVHVFKKIDSSSNTCTLSGNGNNIDGGSTLATAVQYVSYTVQFDGTQWWIQ